jgi:hypothetical protein
MWPPHRRRQVQAVVAAERSAGLAFLQAGAASTLEAYSRQRKQRDRDGPPWGRPSAFLVREEGEVEEEEEEEEEEDEDDGPGGGDGLLQSLGSDHDEGEWEDGEETEDE